MNWTIEILTPEGAEQRAAELDFDNLTPKGRDLLDSIAEQIKNSAGRALTFTYEQPLTSSARNRLGKFDIGIIKKGLESYSWQLTYRLVEGTTDGNGSRQTDQYIINLSPIQVTTEETGIQNAQTQASTSQE